MGIKDASYVDRKYLLDVLATLNEDHLYFDKSYRPAKVELVEKDPDPLEQMMIPDPNNFFAGIPEPDPNKMKKRRGRNIFMTPQQKIEFQMKKLEHKA